MYRYLWGNHRRHPGVETAEQSAIRRTGYPETKKDFPSACARLLSASQNLARKSSERYLQTSSRLLSFDAMKQHDKRAEGEVTTLACRYDSIKTMIATYGRLYDISRDVISAHMPVLCGARPKYLYQILLAVARLNQPSKAMVIHTMCSDKGSALQAIDHLHSVGYLRSVDKPRLIKPFRKYKIDKGYELTDRGWQALCAIILGE